MPQYLILARDGTDDQALERRMAARPRHLEGASKLKAEGHFLVGGATLDEKGTMNGSMMLVEFPDDAAFQAYLKQDPYVTEGVWTEIEVKPFRVATVE